MSNSDKIGSRTTGHRNAIVLITTIAVLMWAASAFGQRGMGNSRGIAQLALKPDVVRISGKLKEIKTHPCEHTTGKAELGTHLILEDRQGRQLNIHLGPAPALAEAVKRLKVGTRLDLLGFRTDQMPPNQYVAKTLILGSRLIQLRDSELRPYWSGGKSKYEARPRYGLGYGGQRAIDAANRRGRCYQGLWRGGRQDALRVVPLRRCRRKTGWCGQYGKNGGR